MHRVERLRLDRRAGKRGDRLSCRVRLLRGDTAMLDGEVGCVAGRVTRSRSDNLAVRVDRDEAVMRGEPNARNRRPE